MISIFIMYSCDRTKALEYTLSCLRDMPLYEQCQRTIIVDGKTNVVPPDWEIVQVPRLNDKFCWGKMWDAGVAISEHEKVIYLDSDRLLPKNYLGLVNRYLEDDMFIFTSRHYMMTKEISLDLCKEILESGDFLHPETFGVFQFEPRREKLYCGPGKNVMSGSTAFTRSTYMRLGGVDHWYCGHGAYADTDFQFTAAQGCDFLDLGINELHFPHQKLNNDGGVLAQKRLCILGLGNFIYFCQKWGLPITLAEELASESKLKNPQQYVGKKWKEIMVDAKGF